MSNLKTLEGNLIEFKAGFMIGMVAALDSLSELEDKYTTADVDPFEALNKAAIELRDWLFGDGDSPSMIKTDTLDELPIITMGKGSEREMEIVLPPGVERLRGVQYIDEDDGDAWRSRMDPRTEVEED